jgi:hypothetical protein
VSTRQQAGRLLTIVLPITESASHFIVLIVNGAKYRGMVISTTGPPRSRHSDLSRPEFICGESQNCCKVRKHAHSHASIKPSLQSEQTPAPQRTSANKKCHNKRMKQERLARKPTSAQQGCAKSNSIKFNV